MQSPVQQAHSNVRGNIVCAINPSVVTRHRVVVIEDGILVSVLPPQLSWLILVLVIVANDVSRMK
ncbi:hypothetical protein OE88DRAFT_1667419 [Heliocybe sulcata]|uniref:Uncharacterized protein n=1 Tax=Heliocybe sulcata TaxID=5364 RepID=A0A5C3MZ10_9AGAM|nr:hypothetical protein OE88DRAFT_1667419 [Heliocybe sulcata]